MVGGLYPVVNAVLHFGRITTDVEAGGRSPASVAVD
jgi:putative ABC transport system permease protein